jgi:hypothetical protein
MLCRSLLKTVAVLSIAAAPTRAQRVAPAALTSRSPADSLSRYSPGGPLSSWGGAVAMRPYAPVISAIVPGGGQLVLGNNRFVVYAAVELLSWFNYRRDTREQANQEALFKDIARKVARSHFSATLPDADWAYYEQMRDFIESGAYSLTDQGPVVPETDTRTYNGSRWVLAQATHANDRAAALAEYERIAIKPDFRWSWQNAQLQYDIFIRTTDSRNDAYHSAITDLMLIGANHVISMVDAFATFRLQVQPQQNGRTGIGASLRW